MALTPLGRLFAPTRLDTTRKGILHHMFTLLLSILIFFSPRLNSRASRGLEGRAVGIHGQAGRERGLT